jgi:predicted O-methyltransferase YrrM
MTNSSLNKNIFGDDLYTISDEDLKIRAGILSKQFNDLIIKNKELSAYFENMINNFSNERYLILVIKFLRLLTNSSSSFNNEINSLHASGKILNSFEKVFINWISELDLLSMAKNTRMREVYAAQLFPLLKDVSIPLGVIHQESHHANHVDMLYVCGMANIVEAKKIFEFGTYRGQTTCGLASVCKEAHIYTLNLPIEDDPRYAPFIGMYINQSLDRDRITQIYCDSKTFDTSSLRGAIDYIFIDGDHSYEGVKNDTEKALEMLKPGGLIVWHDYAAKSPGVLEYLSEFSQERPLFHLRKTCLAVYIDGLNAEEAQLEQMDISLELSEYYEDI